MERGVVVGAGIYMESRMLTGNGQNSSFAHEEREAVERIHLRDHGVPGICVNFPFLLSSHTMWRKAQAG